MAIRIAAQPVSDTQAELLSEAKDGLELDDLGESLLQVCRDADITSGREAIHPDWKHLFNANSQTLRGNLSSRDFDCLLRVFGQPDPFDPELRSLSLKGKRITFLLGAGASKPSGIPTVKELLPDLLARARRLERDDLRQLADYCEKAQINNIEDLLTAAHLSEYCSHNADVLRLVEFLLFRRETTSSEKMIPASMRRRPTDLSGVAFLQDTLEVLFGLLSSRMLPARPNTAHVAIADYVRKNKSSSIITTNYDCCMDLALGEEEKDFTYHVTFANAKAAPSAKNVPLIKLHGSLNWFYCETCQKVHLTNIKKTTDDYLNDKSQYSVIAVCRECNGQRRGLLVPPQALKFDAAPPLTPLLGHAQDAFDGADIILVVGFSFADADVYISRMLTKALQGSKRMRVILFDPDVSVVEKLRKQLSLRLDGFDARRVLGVSGDCANYLPCFLLGKLPQTDDSASNRKRLKAAHEMGLTRMTNVKVRAPERV
jgi:NAD-dependent SIR2 family protein deacetylase